MFLREWLPFGCRLFPQNVLSLLLVQGILLNYPSANSFPKLIVERVLVLSRLRQFQKVHHHS